MANRIQVTDSNPTSFIREEKIMDSIYDSLTYDSLTLNYRLRKGQQIENKILALLKRWLPIFTSFVGLLMIFEMLWTGDIDDWWIIGVIGIIPITIFRLMIEIDALAYCICKKLSLYFVRLKGNYER